MSNEPRITRKKLYLASYAEVTMKKIAEHACPRAKNFEGLSAVFIPTAGDPYENKDFVEEDRIALEKMGAKVQILDLKSASKPEIAQALQKADILLVAGGDTFYLMDQVLRSGAAEMIRDFVESGKIYIGSSAGSIICCPTIEGAEEFDNPKLAPDLRNYDGLNLFPGVIIPHVHKPKYFERVKRAKQKLEGEGFKVFPLTDDDVLFYDNQEEMLI